MEGCRHFCFFVLFMFYRDSFFAPITAEDKISKRILVGPQEESVMRKSVNSANKNVNRPRFHKTRFNSRRRQVFDASKIDIVFVADALSIGGFNREKTFLKDLIGHLPIFPTKIRIAFVSALKIEFNFKKNNNKECAIKQIQNIAYAGGPSSLGRALDLARVNLIFNSNAGARQNAQKVMVILIDRILDNTFRYISTKLKQRGVEIITVAVTESFRTDEQLSIESRKDYIDAKNNLVNLFGGDATRQCQKRITHDECGRRCKCINGKLVECCRVRKQFTEMSNTERARYVEVVKTASTHPSYKESYEKLLTIHKIMFNTGIHQSRFFLPWHRWFILQYEDLLREIDCSITVPYWESSEEANDALASDVWNAGNHGFGGNGTGTTNCVLDGPFKAGEWSVIASAGGGCLTRNFNGRFPDCLTVRDAFLEFSDVAEFDDFERFLHREFHDAVHCVVGGLMCTDSSASTPEFFLHHAFVDKLWSDWQSQSNSHKLIERFMLQNISMPSNTYFSRDFLDLRDQPGCVCVEYRDPGDEIYTTVNGFSKTQVKEIPRMPLPPYPEKAKLLFKVTDGDIQRLQEIRQFLQPVQVLRENALEGKDRVLGFRMKDVERVKGEVSSNSDNFRSVGEGEDQSQAEGEDENTGR